METITAVIILSVASPPLPWAVRESHAQRVNSARTMTIYTVVTEYDPV
jgi:hypothetical protein